MDLHHPRRFVILAEELHFTQAHLSEVRLSE